MVSDIFKWLRYSVKGMTVVSDIFKWLRYSVKGMTVVSDIFIILKLEALLCADV